MGGTDAVDLSAVRTATDFPAQSRRLRHLPDWLRARAEHLDSRYLPILRRGLRVESAYERWRCKSVD